MGNSISALLHMPYDNYKVYHPDDTLMFYCSKRKADWYLKRNLAEYIGDNMIKLLFTPGGYGDPLTILEGRTNTCVVDNSSTNLTKHHVVPSQFRKHFPLEYKDKNSCDIAVMSRKNHDKYEIDADKFKQRLFDDFIVDINKEINSAWYTAKSMYRTITYHYDKLPATKQIYFQMKYDGLVERYGFKEEDFVNIYSPYSSDNNKHIVENVGIENLIILCKLHFLKYAKPKYLPEWWKPNMIKIITRKEGVNHQKSELKMVDMFADQNLLQLIIKYDLYEIASLHV